MRGTFILELMPPEAWIGPFINLHCIVKENLIMRIVKKSRLMNFYYFVPNSCMLSARYYRKKS